MFVQCIVYCVQCTPSPLWLKSVPGWPAISVSTWQESRVGQIVWFGCLSAISQLASREGEGGGVRQLCLHSVTQPFTTWPRWREQGGGLCSLPLAPAERAETFSLFPLSPSILLGLHLGNDELKAYALCLLTLFDYKIFHRKETMLRI